MRDRIFSLLDLTSLNAHDTEQSIQTLCQKAIFPGGHVAAICVYPEFVKTAVTYLANNIPVAAVANFPTGNESLENVSISIQQSIAQGAREIDVVFPYQEYLTGDKTTALKFIQMCKSICGKNILLKVILETGALQDPVVIAKASQDVIESGADFLKTSTGKISVGATLDAATLMLQAIKDSKKSVGLKVSGGIRELSQAEQYILLAEKIMGEAWVVPQHFRIGASSLIDSV